MNHLKIFNEELSPVVYRRAALMLKKYNKDDRAIALNDYADGKEFTFFDFLLSTALGFILSKGTPVKFTNPSFTISDDDDYESFTKEWSEGERSLMIKIDFQFKPLSSELKNLKGIEPWQKINLFSIEFLLALDGNSDSVRTLYDDNKCNQIFLIQGNHKEYTGVFSDRQSALKFKREVIPLVADAAKDHIMEILSIVGGTSEDVEKAMDAFKNIRVNALYDKLEPGVPEQAGWNKKWFKTIKIN